MFISFEGIDGCGKTTQLHLLGDYFRANGKDVLEIREPGGTEFSEKVRNLLLSAKGVFPYISELFLFEAARTHLVEELIKPKLAAGAIVLSDRFFDSTTAYQGYGRGIPLKEIKNCNILATGGLKPDLTFFLDIPLELAQKRAGKRKPDRIEASGDDFYMKVINGFKEIAKSEPKRIITIDATNQIEETHKLIVETIEKRMKKADKSGK